ncbi:hypothetical protein ACQP04_23620 [Pseudonocardia halophobica]|uniref:hypothetical protein n=1 Tax=Pseudonocardia halophobica TaxID=29401 RepID=UPI003D92AB86
MSELDQERVIIGAGFAGVGALIEPRRRGMSARLIEAGTDVGGDVVLEPLYRSRDDPADGPVDEQVRAVLAEGVTTRSTPPASRRWSSRRGRPGAARQPRHHRRASDPEAALTLGLIHAQVIGITVKGIVEGDSDPDVFLPEDRG